MVKATRTSNIGRVMAVELDQRLLQWGHAAKIASMPPG
jgi:hypothetical protein